MRITSIEPITWKVSEPLPGEFPCMCCHGVNGNATHFVHAEVDGDIKGKFTSLLKLPACGKCAAYATLYPTWLEEMLFKRRMEAAKQTMPETVPAMEVGF